MPKSKSMKDNQATNKHKCDFCGREFIRETTIARHLCENKRRYQDKDKHGNRIGFQAWLRFYARNSNSKKQKTYDDFIKSAYYIAFVKFGNYCIDINALNVNRYADWLLKNNISIDNWNKDTNYNAFLLEFLKTEDPLDAVARSIETTIELAQQDKIQTKDTLRYGNSYKICYQITKGKISPWMLYQSKSGVEFLEKLDHTQQKMIMDYINPEQWAIKFKRDASKIKEVKELLNAGGY